MKYEALLTLTLNDTTSRERREFYEKLEDSFHWEKRDDTETTWSKSKPIPYNTPVSENFIDSFIEEVKDNLRDAADYAGISYMDFNSVFTVGLGKTETY